MKVYVDLDGVLADFDKSAERILGTNNIYKFEFIWGAKVFWDKLNAYPKFFRNMDLTNDARHLWAHIQHLNPSILTALPHTNSERVAEQKTAWVREHIPGSPEVICCQTKDKPNYCTPGDILIDDRAVNRDMWIGQGGTYIIHTDAKRTIGTLQALGVI